MREINLKGMGVAMITPFNEDETVDYDALSNLIDYQLQSGTDYLVVLGTTAETPTLSEDEKHNIVDLFTSKAKGKIPIVLGIGGNNTRELVHELKSKSFSGIDAVLSVVPYYNKPNQEGIYQHYKAIAEASKLPVVMYNIPGRTGVNMAVDTTLKLANECKNIVGVKEASGNLSQMDEIIRRKPAGFEVISGDDSFTLPLISLGGVGIISVLGNALPKEFGKMVSLALNGDSAQALAIHHSLGVLYKYLFVDGNPAGVKSALHAMGYIKNTLRLPLVPASAATSEKIKEALIELGVKC